MKKQYLIRYNTESRSDLDRWRLIDGQEEILVSEIIINVHSRTSCDFMEGVGYKYHIRCEGQLALEHNIATIY